ncbi:MBL fold metallo-hydrolase [Deinococcus pimensis]|uniref:MBL fold metallo-hydrolase n=1 Tax=Deinococcus pimensis TaxID=309888 RepID=UPI0004B9C18C|nr:MBL fold metallo-hydrolase [Deinococcus pimensis]
MTALTPHGQPARFEPGLREVAPGVHAYLTPNGSWSESNAGLVVSGDHALLIDTQWDAHLTLRLLQAVHAAAPHAPITTLVNTHADGDHIFGNALVGAPEVVMTERAARDALHETPGSLVAFQRLTRALRGVPLPRSAARTRDFVADVLAPFDFTGVRPAAPTRTFTGSLDLLVGSRRVRVEEYGHAHTSSDSVVTVPDAGVVFAGDLLFVGVTPVMWAGPITTWRAHLARLLALDADVYVPGHGPVCGKEEVRLLDAYFDLLGRAGGALLARGLPPHEAARAFLDSGEFRASPFAAWDNPERVYINLLTMSRAGGRAETPVKPLDRALAFHHMAQLAARGS